MPRQDFILQPYTYSGSNEQVWDFPLDDFYSNGVLQPTPYGDSDNQHKLDIVVNNIGAIKQFPLLGFGVFQYENAEVKTDFIYNSLSNQMKSDGYRVEIGAIKITSNKSFDIDTDKIANAY